MSDQEENIRYFETNSDSIPLVNKTTKLNADKSLFAKEAVAKETFEKKADEAVGRHQERRARAVELVDQYWLFINDKTLSKNKGPLQKSLEKELLNKLVTYASEVNNDENEPEGMGSIAMITLLFKSIIHLRDQNNDLDFKISQLEKLVKASSESSKPNAK